MNLDMGMDEVVIVRAFLFLSSIFLIQFYFAKRLRNSLLSIKNFDKRKLNKIIISFLIISDVWPIFQMISYIYGVISPTTDWEFTNSYFISYYIKLPSWIIITIIVQIVLLFLPIDLLIFLFKKFHFFSSTSFKIKLSRLFLLTSLFFLIFIPLNIVYNYYYVEVNKIVYNSKKLWKNFNGFKIVFFADVQMDQFTTEKRVARFIEKVRQQNPDLVLIGGDFISNSIKYIKPVAQLTSTIDSEFGIFSTIGDHDFYGMKKYYWRSFDSVKKTLEFYGIKMIDNGNLIFQKNDLTLLVTFLTSTYVKNYDEEVFDSLALSTSRGDIKILLTHQPKKEIALKAKEKGYDLYLAGHTHGGQVNFIFPFINISPVWYENKYLGGGYKFNNLLMIVNRGLGYSSLPLRYNAMPEITVIELKGTE